jgi:hypothetical protein
MSTLLEQASLVMIPSGYAEDIVYSVIPQSGAGDLSFTRASNGTRVNSAGLVEVVAWNLVEYSEDFSNAAWTQSAVTITANSTTAPNGTTTADTIAFSSGGYFGQTFTNNGLMTISIYAKYIGTQWLCVENFNQSDKAGWFDLLNGVIGGTANGATNSIENVGNGWYRCSVTMTATDVASSTYAIFSVSANNGFTRSGSAYFWGAQLNIGSTAKPYFPTTDRLNVPRLTYQNGGGGCPSLLLEKQSTNLELWSEDLTNAVYISGAGAGGSITRTANYAISPDGTQNADRLQVVRGSVYAELYQRVGVTIGNTYTFSFWAKSFSGTPTLKTVWNGGYENEVTFTTDWVRYTYTFVALDTTAGFNFVTFTGLPNTSTTADILVWGAQMESSSYATSYIPSTSSSATRVADACFKTGISSLIGQTEGVLFTDFVCNGFQDYGTPLCVNDGSVNNSIWLTTFGNGTLRGEVFGSGSVQASFSMSGAVVGQRYKMALAYKANDFAMYINGTLIGTDSSGTIPSNLSRVDYDYANPAVYSLSLLQINESILFPTRLTNSEIAQLTGNQNYTINQAYASYGVASESPNCVQP